MNKSVIPVILCGGSGTRLWPMSRQLYPKQFIPLREGKSLFQETVNRVQRLDAEMQTMVVCNEEHRFMAAEQLRSMGVEHADILLEPVGRNTAPAIALAALQAQAKEKDAILLVLPADHLVSDLDQFAASVEQGLRACEAGRLVTFGVQPTRAETGYGYIQRGESLTEFGELSYQIESFVEKPDAERANQYLQSGDYYWNSGMFMFRASDYLDQLAQQAPEIAKASQAAFEGSSKDLDFIRIDEQQFAACPSDSIDYAVMEHTDRGSVVALQSAWSDVGSWHALWEANAHDAQGNATVGDAIVEDCQGCYVHANHRLVSAVGMQDHVIIETADAVLVTPRGRAQDVKKIVNHLADNQREEATSHRKVYRPWGAYESIDTDARFQVKRITVNPGERLSLQKHHHRAEHWIVVKGTAKITRGEEEFLLSENESTYIPLGTVHRMENPGMIPLELIEVQSGSYLGEDDIERFEDNYGRSG